MISSRVPTVSAEALAPPPTDLIDYYIAANEWPSVWKCGDVIPLFKKDSKTNYRPLSVLVLTSLSKIFERVQHNQMLAFPKSVLNDRLSGFLKALFMYNRSS